MKTEAARLGFSHIGFTTPTPQKHTATYLAWINRNLHADMAYLAQPDRLEKIQDPLKIMPACQTVVVLALPYRPAPRPTSTSCHTGQVASYAVGKDYHIIIPALLEKLVQTIQAGFTQLNFDYKIYTDTGPILEKAFAQSAGLGWIGKNGCLIIPGVGSYVLLAELLINLNIPPDKPFPADHCGSCRACLEACPTQCILENRTLNAADCLSYQTIENKATIPEKKRAALGNWVFGCDICQIVCPWNQRFAVQPDHLFFEPIDSLPLLNLDDLILLTPQEFNKKFKDNPIKRAKRFGYYRNLCVVLGNTKSRRYLPFLQELLSQESDPILLEHAAWAIQQIED